MDRPSSTETDIPQKLGDVGRALHTLNERLRKLEVEHEAVLDVLQQHKAAIKEIEAFIKGAAGPTPGPRGGLN